MERKSIAKLAVVLCCVFLPVGAYGAYSQTDKSENDTWIRVISDECVYDNDNHAAFTSLEAWKGSLIVAFREAGYHRPTVTDKGKIRVLRQTKKGWEPQHTFSMEGEDLRDPDILTFKNRLLLYTHGYFSEYKKTGWTSLKPMIHNAPFNPSIWKKRVHKEKIYGVGNKWEKWPYLMQSDDGENWKTIAEYKIGGNASEADMVFVADTMYICIRIDSPVGSNSMWGKTVYPYTDCQWTMMDISVASPEMIYVSDDTFLLAGREYDLHRKQGKDKVNVSLFAINKEGKVKKKYIVEQQGGDQGYASIVKGKGDIYYMSYYAGMMKTTVRMLTFKINKDALK